MTALLLGWSNVIMPLLFPCEKKNIIYRFFLILTFLVNNYNIQKYPDSLDKAAELAVSTLQVIF